MNNTYRILITLIFWGLFGIQIPAAAQGVTKIFSLAWNPDGTILAVGGIFDGLRAVRLVDTNGQILHQFDDDPNSIGGLSWRPDGAQIAILGAYRYTIRDVATGAIVVTFAQQGTTADEFTHWNPSDLNQIATVAQDIVYVRDASNGQIQATLDAPGGTPDAVLSVGWSPDGTTLYTVSQDNLIRVWNVSAAALLQEIPLDIGADSFAMSPDGSRLAIAQGDEALHLYDTSGTLLTAFESLPNLPTRGAIIHLVWNAAGTQIGGISGGEGIHVWDVGTGAFVTTLPHRTEDRSETGFTFSPNGALMYPSGDPIDLFLSAPIANAGADQTLTDNDGSGSELVTLHGTGSDSDGTIVAYSWSENGVEIAMGATPQVNLTVGIHTILLAVTDDDGATGGDVVVITVE